MGFGRFKLWLYAAGAALTAIVAAYFRGRSDANDDAHERELNEYVETRRRIDDTTIPRDASDALEWLHKRQSKRDM